MFESAPIELLHKDLPVAPVDCCGDRPGSTRSGGEKCERGHPGQLAVPGNGEPLSRGDPDANTREAARPDAHENALRIAAAQKLVEHGHESLAVSAANDFVAAI